MTAARNAQEYGQGIRAVYPNTFIAHAPIWNPNPPNQYPVIYQAFNTFCDAVMPQAYAALGSTAGYVRNESGAQMAIDTDHAWSNAYSSATWPSSAIKPICPVVWTVGMSSDTPPPPFTTAAQISDFVNTLEHVCPQASPNGYPGVSFFRSELQTAEIWDAINGIRIGSDGKVGDVLTLTSSLSQPGASYGWAIIGSAAAFICPQPTGSTVQLQLNSVGTVTVHLTYRPPGTTSATANCSAERTINIQPP